MRYKDLVTEVRNNLDIPIFRRLREKIAYSLTEKRGYDNERSWSLAGLLIEQYANQRFKTIGQLYDHMIQKDISEEVIKLAER